MQLIEEREVTIEFVSKPLFDTSIIAGRLRITDHVNLAFRSDCQPLILNVMKKIAMPWAALPTILITFLFSATSQGQLPEQTLDIQALPAVNMHTVEVTSIDPMERNSNPYEFLRWYSDGQYTITYKMSRVDSMNFGSSDYVEEQDKVEVLSIVKSNYSPISPGPKKLDVSGPPSSAYPSTFLLNITGANFEMVRFRKAVPGHPIFLIFHHREVEANFERPAAATITIDGLDPQYWQFKAENNPDLMTPFNQVKSRNSLEWKYESTDSLERTMMLALEIDESIVDLELDVIPITITHEYVADGVTYTNSYPYEIELFAAHDPNQMTVDISEVTQPDFSEKTQQYRVDFENDGNSNANHIVVKCRMDRRINLDAFDPNSVQFLIDARATSVNFTTDISTADSTITFELLNCALPGLDDRQAPTYDPDLCSASILFQTTTKTNVNLEGAPTGELRRNYL